MTRYHLVPLLAGSLLSTASAETLIFWDNFNTGLGQLALDSAPLDGRRSGTESGLMVRSSQVQQVSIADQLYMWGSGGRVRFQNNESTWCNWAALPSATEILSAGGLTVEFTIRWTFNATPGHFIAFSTGMKGESGGEPLVRVTDPETDYGFMIGKDGVYTRYGNGVAIGDAVTGSSAIARQVKLEYAFNSFADGSPVTVKTTVAGQVISYDHFTWNGNAGELYMELENRGSDTYFDDLKVSTATVYSIDYTAGEFASGAAAGTVVGDFRGLTLLDESGEELSTYALVAGEGDTDNGKFTINSLGQLVTGAYDFKLGPAGTSYTIRVQGTGSQSGKTSQKVFTVTPVKDDDADRLPDAWELSFPGNTSLANLTGLVYGPGPGAGSGDYDGDGMDDLSEYQRSLTTPGYSAFTADSDGDGIDDNEEEIPTISGHVVTNALLADTDRDGLLDGAEYSLGTNPALADTDGDGARDNFEIDRGSNPADFASRPALPPGFSLVQVTDEASTGISTSKSYTHKIAGGAAATINGVAFDVLTNAATPANFAWTVNGTKNVAVGNLGNWSAANGGVSGSGLLDLYNSFTYASLGTGSIQTFELSGLTPGQTYQLKLFIRKFASGSQRPIDLTFTNGSDVVTPFAALLYDRPDIVLNGGNQDSAYYLSYTYVAQGTTLSIGAVHAAASPAESGSAHFYGLTNEVVGTPMTILSVTRNPAGSVTISFQGDASTTYQVTKSADIKSGFVPLTIPLSVTTDASGVGQAVVPASEASEAKEFYRIQN